MHKAIHILVTLGLVLLYGVGVAVAQNTLLPPPLPGSNNSNTNYIPPVGVPIDYDDPDGTKAAAAAAADTSKNKKRERKPLESFFFDDSLRMTRIFAWKVNPAYNSIHRVAVDTMLGGTFQQDYSFMQIDGGIGSTYLGNIGSATIPLNYFSRPSINEDFSFVQGWNAYILRPKDVVFYNAKLPYSRLTYSMSGAVREEENLLNVILSHNVSPSTSFNIVYNAESTNGLYLNQKTMNRYFSASFSHTGKRYSIQGGYIYNHGQIAENGGVRNDKDITDTVLNQSNLIRVNMQNATNVYRGNTVWWTQSYGIPLRKQKEDELTIQKIPTIYIGQAFEFSHFKKHYIATDDSMLYRNNYVDHRIGSDDYVFQRQFDVKAFMQLQPYNRDGVLGLISAGVGNQSNEYYYQPVPEALVERFGTGGSQMRNTTYLYGGLEGRVSKYFDWGADVRFNLLGYKAGDFDVGARIKLSAYTKKGSPITLDARASFTLTEPDFWVQSYFSSHLAWQNSFTKTSSLTASAKFSIPSIGLYLGADYQVSQGKVYYDSLKMPAQWNNALSVLGVYLQKDFRAGGFHFNHRVLFQLSSAQEVAPVPMLSAYLSYYYAFAVVRNVLDIQVGIDGRYQTKYYAFGYSPALGQYYNQREKELGGYPYLDAFVAGKWKRLRVLLKLQHWNENLLGDRNYFMALHYPQNRMMFKIKVSWSFYD